jgi:GNAT superfamily N-acetyltransferase
MTKEVIHIAKSRAEVESCFPVMSQLRPSYSLDSFCVRVLEQQERGYVMASVQTEGMIVAVAGYQIRETLCDGRFLHVDDLVTLESHRSLGYGTRLIAWLRNEAERHGCVSLQLDSALHRQDAHRFYEREGLERVAFHYHLNSPR